MNLYLLEPDQPGPRWAPFAGARPIAELRAGIFTIRERWERVFDVPATGIIGNHVEGFADVGHPPVVPSGSVVGPALVADSTFAPRAGTPLTPDVERLTHEGRTVAWVLPEGESWSGPPTGGREQPIDGLQLDECADLLGALTTLLPDDAAWFAAQTSPNIPEGSIVLGDPADVVLRGGGATVEPGVVFDTRQGPVVVDGAGVRNGSRLEGPLYVGADTVILGGFVRRSVIGPHCRIRGEVSGSVFLGYANKAHDGFVGDSVIGHWVNLGALTTTSNLKNTYGAVSLNAGGESWDTGRRFLGSLIGDHVKTAIGTMLGTGTIIGAGANVFDAPAVPKFVPPFAWGGTGRRPHAVRRVPAGRRACHATAWRRVDADEKRCRSLEQLHARLAPVKTRLYALGSGSQGNAFALEHDGAVLLIDVGFSAKEIRRRAEVAGLPLDTVVGIALTHEHGDHTSWRQGSHQGDRRADCFITRYVAQGAAQVGALRPHSRAGWLRWSRWAPSSSKLASRATTPSSRWPLPYAHRRAHQWGLPMMSAVRPPRCDFCFVTRPRWSSRPTTTK